MFMIPGVFYRLCLHWLHIFNSTGCNAVKFSNFYLNHGIAINTIKRIALTAGEPAGIGSDICIQLAQQNLPCQLVVIGAPALLEQRARQLKIPVDINEFNKSDPVVAHTAGCLTVLPVELAETVYCGQLNPANSSYVLKTIALATHACLDGSFDAMVTAPVHKGVINDAGFAFTGHTEYIAEMTGGHPVMMLATSVLRVALVTTHLPLAKVSQAITQSRLKTVIEILVKELQSRFGIKNPQILVCGLNPHAGEGGHLGREEIDVISPIIDYFRWLDINVKGPLPADTVFTQKYLQTADAVLAMYHDQGLPVLKYSGFGEAVNITLGLPIIRTSVDHGTALDLAGSGQADAGSLKFALQTALEMAAHTKK
jgi:4-hydroxythreonine-4-phosphate dehydrogenase